jgi:drug/metabolite transporter (DMT)-like permease
LKSSDVVDLVALAAIWGASFLFMRMGAAQFGPVSLAGVRVVGASLFLLPLLAYKGQLGMLRTHWRALLVVGLLNSALPFLCFTFAALSITAGMSSIFNASTPLWGALIAWLWLKDRLSAWRVAGLFIGFAGVAWMAWDKASFKPGGSGWAVVACMAATACYGLAASYIKRRLTGVPSLAVAAGSQFGAAVALAVPTVLWWPETSPSAGAWGAAAVLALGCTGVAYLLFFRLIANVGPANAITVTFLIPVFGVLWGLLFLDEGVNLAMLFGCATIVAGTCLTTGVIDPSRPRLAATR